MADDVILIIRGMSLPELEILLGTSNGQNLPTALRTEALRRWTILISTPVRSQPSTFNKQHSSAA